MSADWFSTCPACGKPLGPWTLGDDKLCRGHEFPVKVNIDYPDQQTKFGPTNAQVRATQRRERKRQVEAKRTVKKADDFTDIHGGELSAYSNYGRHA